MMKKVVVLFFWVGLATVGFAQGETPQAEKVLTGVFENRTGVMQEISCYCYEAGYLQRKKEETPLCFDSGTVLPRKAKVKLIGVFEERSRVEGANDPCKAGTLRVFRVKKIIIKKIIIP